MECKIDSLQHAAPADSVRLDQDLFFPGCQLDSLPTARKSGFCQHRITDHLAHNFSGRKLSHQSGTHCLATTHHRNSVANFEDFIREVRDVDNHTAVSFQEANDPKKPMFF